MLGIQLWVLCLFLFKAALLEQSEEHILGLEEFLTDLDPDTSDIILDLLEAQELPSNKANRVMRRLMRKLRPDQLDKLFEIYKQTRD